MIIIIIVIMKIILTFVAIFVSFIMFISVQSKVIPLEFIKNEKKLYIIFFNG